MIFRTQSNSVYEVDFDNKKVRRINGVNEPTARQGKDGEWRKYIDIVLKENTPCYIVWDPKDTPLNDISDKRNLPMTVTSIVKEIYNHGLS
jgi:hypothetical protein